MVATVQTIVVGVDGSEPSLRALSAAADLARGLDAHLSVVFARYIYLALPQHVAEDLFADVLADAERAVEGLVRSGLEGCGVEWSFESHEGHPEEVIGDVATRTDAAFVVVGRSGWSTLHEVLLGSVSSRLAHRTDWPVLLVS